MSQALEDWRRSVVRVCDGRGFIVETEREGHSLSRRQNTYRTYHQATPRHAAVALIMAIGRPMVEDEEAKGLEGFFLPTRSSGSST